MGVPVSSVSSVGGGRKDQGPPQLNRTFPHLPPPFTPPPLPPNFISTPSDKREKAHPLRIDLPMIATSDLAGLSWGKARSPRPSQPAALSNHPEMMGSRAEGDERLCAL